MELIDNFLEWFYLYKGLLWGLALIGFVSFWAIFLSQLVKRCPKCGKRAALENKGVTGGEGLLSNTKLKNRVCKYCGHTVWRPAQYDYGSWGR